MEDVAEGRNGRKKAHRRWIGRGLGEGKGRAEHSDRQGREQQIGQVRGQKGQFDGSLGAGHSGVQAKGNSRVRRKAGEKRKKNRAQLAE